jgi:hypothetical protein
MPKSTHKLVKKALILHHNFKINSYGTQKQVIDSASNQEW